jgi:hypothetical protein
MYLKIRKNKHKKTFNKIPGPYILPLQEHRGHCNDFAPCGPSIGQYNSYSYYTEIFLLSSVNPVKTITEAT